MNNISAYNTVCKNKKVSELFLGTIEVNSGVPKSQLRGNLYRSGASDFSGKDDLRDN